ncbi:AraC family transcriptional regulator [Caldalkalibacillus mannanilyticus]|uniref:AraC family transcriptional regulator n=1 Tax=Caldalkalibacillus mannanilyticus TaxID=1418 RepID=UPI00046A0E4B|nr:AraC family transcriptional regulator [Caldalkalibacillus mannanilyticus]
MKTSNRIKIPQGFWEGLCKLDITASEIARKAQLPFTVITGREVSITQYYAIWQAYSDLIGDTAKGIIQLATVYETNKYPPTVLATYHARDYREAIYRMAKYKQQCPPEFLRIIEDGEICTIELEWQHTEQSGPPILLGATLAQVLELGRRGTGESLKARLVELSHAVGDRQALEAYFSCPVRMGAQNNRLTLHRSDLDRPFVTHNQELLEILTPVLDQSLDEYQCSHSITEKVKWIIKRSLTAGQPEIRTVASELGMSSRTLQRRLTDEHTSFKQLLNEAKHEQARMYLANPSLNMKEVAFLIGYEDQSSFYRAFRHWEGDTPSNWRNAHLDSLSISQ